MEEQGLFSNVRHYSGPLASPIDDLLILIPCDLGQLHKRRGIAAHRRDVRARRRRGGGRGLRGRQHQDAQAGMCYYVILFFATNFEGFPFPNILLFFEDITIQYALALLDNRLLVNLNKFLNP